MTERGIIRGTCWVDGVAKGRGGADRVEPVESDILATTSALENFGGIEGAVTTQRGVVGSIDTKATPRHDEGKRVRCSLGGPPVRSVSRWMSSYTNSLRSARVAWGPRRACRTAG